MDDQIMAGESTPSSSAKARPLRVWPALALVILILAARFGPMAVEGGMASYWMISVFGPMLCCLLLLIWWLAASRATWKERLFGLLGLVGALGAVLVLVHPTMRGPGITYYILPSGMVAFAVAAAISRFRSPGARTVGAVGSAFVVLALSIFVRNEGMNGNYVMVLRPRWSADSEATILAAGRSPGGSLSTNATSHAALANPEWPGFRGTDRTGRWNGPKISTNWAAQPPKQLWKIPVGPGWSSFAVAGDLLFTQEQRGPMEAIVCYDAKTGQEIWKQQFEGRLDDPLGGPGPRATPTIASNALFATCAAGTFARLDPVTGAVVWKQDLKQVANRGIPMWGFSSSPLVVGATVVVYAGGGGDKGVLGFDSTSGKLLWSLPTGIDSYSSPQLSAVAGEKCVLMLSNDGLLVLDPAAGKTLLNYEWKSMAYRALQPSVIGGDTVLLPTSMNIGTRAIQISKQEGKLTAKELWTSKTLKPDFTDFVIYEGHGYGVDGGILACVDLKSGERKWKGGRYGKGQVLLLENSGLLLVSSEQGDVLLVRATPSGHEEVASLKVLNGKTWNHPVLAGDRLFVRNSQEAAACQVVLLNSPASKPLSKAAGSAAGKDPG